ncbi:MAG: NAD(P)-dependent oxidoreductase [Candidatus Latescibacteria bacterium]|jgi:nucleoside-diphosphate-sugar epimerase|nr:NAD(P)-dependent oxidoreductase [Candidatus Latescibacterota bacterium]
MAKKVLVTGVYGLIAGAVYDWLNEQPEKYEAYGLARRQISSDRVAEGHVVQVPEERFFLADMADQDAVYKAFDGMHTVVHMAANPNPDASWEAILQSNMIGAYNAFEGCRQMGVKRIVYASSIMTSWGNQLDEPYLAIKEGRFEDVPDGFHIIKHTDPVRPTEPYSASKVWGEGLARTYSDVHGLSCLCLRIGWVNAEDKPTGLENGAFWCSQRDIVQLVGLSVEAPDEMTFDIFYGLSECQYRWADIDHARNVLGYAPQDRAEDRL